MDEVEGFILVSRVRNSVTYFPERGARMARRDPPPPRLRRAEVRGEGWRERRWATEQPGVYEGGATPSAGMPRPENVSEFLTRDTKRVEGDRQRKKPVARDADGLRTVTPIAGLLRSSISDSRQAATAYLPTPYS